MPPLSSLQLQPQPQLPDCQRHPPIRLPYTGPAIPGTELRIVDPRTLADVPDGEQGVIMIRGGWHLAGEECAFREICVSRGWGCWGHGLCMVVVGGMAVREALPGWRPTSQTLIPHCCLCMRAVHSMP